MCRLSAVEFDAADFGSRTYEDGFVEKSVNTSERTTSPIAGPFHQQVIVCGLIGEKWIAVFVEKGSHSIFRSLKL